MFIPISLFINETFGGQSEQAIKLLLDRLYAVILHCLDCAAFIDFLVGKLFQRLYTPLIEP
ncbi:MAG: hypothetical protein WBP03_02240 [Candidatus Saccharimonadales bacterium]